MNHTLYEEKNILNDLSLLAIKQGYIHAFADICVNSNFMVFDLIKESSTKLSNHHEYLTKNELNLILRLINRRKIDYTLQNTEQIENYKKETFDLLSRLHNCLIPNITSEDDFLPPQDFFHGNRMREPFFYSGESAYAFQYRDFAKIKYQYDNDWFFENLGFTVDEAVLIAKSICDILDENATIFLSNQNMINNKLKLFEISNANLVNKSGLDREIIELFINKFSINIDNASISRIDEFNPVTEKPLIKKDSNNFLVFSHYSIYESLYDTPFYWMIKDKEYKTKANDNRGKFTEEVSKILLVKVFGEENVFVNIDIYSGKDRIGEIDVLVVYLNRLIVLQAKSKKLTIAARQGNSEKIAIDFKKAVQDAYDQAILCSNAILSNKYSLKNSKGEKLEIESGIKEIFPICITSEHYPSLAFQSRHYLKLSKHDIIKKPLITDIFFLDVLTEMLQSPIRLLSYLKMRIALYDNLSINHEHIGLAFHLMHNLYIDEPFDMVMFEDDIAFELDNSMYARREKLPGNTTPKGILTIMDDRKSLKLLFEQIITSNNPDYLEFGFFILSLNSESVAKLDELLEMTSNLTKATNTRHNFIFTSGAYGVCLHCVTQITTKAINTLNEHSEIRKYTTKAKYFFEIIINPNLDILYLKYLNYDWCSSSVMNAKAMIFKLNGNMLSPSIQSATKKTKLGRNDMCYCGSNKKYKKCCMAN